MADLIDRCCQHAATFADAFSAGGYEVLNDVVLNQVLVWIILLLAYRWTNHNATKAHFEHCGTQLASSVAHLMRMQAIVGV